MYCSGGIKYSMWVTAGISTRDGSRRQNVSQCHGSANGVASVKDNPARASENGPSCKVCKHLLLWFWFAHVFDGKSFRPLHALWQTPDEWVILCCMSHTATSWLFSICTQQICQRGPGWKLLQPPLLLSPHMCSQVWLKCVWFWKYENVEELCYLLSSEEEVASAKILGRHTPQASYHFTWFMMWIWSDWHYRRGLK